MKLFCLLLFVSVCAWRDIRTFRIPNGIILAGAAAAVLLRLAREGSGCLPDLAAGCLIPAGICCPLFLFSMIGAADVKMLMVAGLFTGGGQILWLMWYSLLAAAVEALVRAVKYHLSFKRSAYLGEYIRRLAAGEKFPAYIGEEEIRGEQAWLMHLGLSIAAGTVLWMAMQ